MANQGSSEINVNIDGRLITVHRLTLPESIRLTSIVNEAKKTSADLSLEEQMVAQYFYPPMIVVSQGDVPTLDEFLNIPAVLLDNWYNAVDSLNPGMLPQPVMTPQKRKEDDEKKES